MTKTVEELAKRVGGEAVGEIQTPISSLAAIDEAGPTTIAPYFVKSALKQGNVLPGAVVTSDALLQYALDANVPAALVHPNPTLALGELIDLFFEPARPSAGCHPTAVIDPSAAVHPSAIIGPFAVLESGVTVGEGTVVGPNVVLGANSRVGRNVIIGPGAVIGGDGFGFAPSKDGPKKIRHVGSVIIEDNVEIGANTCIDRGTLGATVVGASTKLDNLVQVGHNARIGRGVLVAGQVGLAGSTSVEDGAMLGGQVGVADHLTIGKNAKIAAKSGVTKDVKAGQLVGGYPAMAKENWHRATAWLMRSALRDEGPGTED